MKNITITERERDFLSSILEYFQERGGSQPYVITRKKYKFTDEEMNQLQDKLK